ncbi:hypothetical protein M0802_002792 [Mischocyttarus mexicanus]|nr:hypothetical protein M0802_002792 [Mischocyttarus mexicanus]
MRKETVGVTLCAVTFLALFRIGLSLSIDNEFLLTSLYPNNEDEEPFYNDNTSKILDIYSELDSNTENPNTDNSDTEKNILEINCNKFSTWFNLSDMVIQKIGKNFGNSPFITCLNFERNRISTIEPGAFDNLPNLEYLNLAGNSISPLLSFNGHNNLKTLILANQSGYGERYLKIMGKYPKLRYLDLSGTQIYSIESSNNNMDYDNSLNENLAFPRLRYLDLSRSYFRNFDNNFAFNRNITHLNLGNNNLEQIDLRSYTNLVKLRLENNAIVMIDDICGYKCLCISEMPRLKYLMVSNNQIKDINEDIFTKMEQLVTLDLSNNNLERYFVTKIHKIHSLENIYLNNNKLNSISIKNRLQNLSVLSAANNNLQEIIPNFVDAPNLKKLYLNNNKITIIDEDAFSKLNLLEELYLQDNLLDKLPNKWNKNLRNLRSINLSNNVFKTIESLSLSQSLPLIDIDLVNNKISYLNAEILRNLPENATIYFIPRPEIKVLSMEN